jgi:hypothetical protein
MARDIIREEARLIMLRELHQQTNYALHDGLLQHVLEAFGISKSRDWVREELNWLEDKAAITRTEQASVIVAKLAPKGAEHVEGRLVIEGVKRPSPR